ncbi:MAG TPA: exosortase H [Bryobacteraceae bacterium]|nr:exosortase H [Bryobacteraceae bacterium]
MRPERFLIAFAVCVAIAFGLLFAPFMRPLTATFSDRLTEISGALIGAAGGRVQVEGAVLRAPSSGFAIEMKDGCNGVNVMALLWSAMLAFPASWVWKAKGVLMGTAAIQVINLVRFISLFYLGQYSIAWFDFAHLYLWENLIMADALVVFWLWVSPLLRDAGVPDAAR